MIILSSEQLRKADAYTIEHEPIASVDLMERASNACVDEITSVFSGKQSAAVFCGIGNNGGDGLVIARRLHQLGWNIRVFLVHFATKQSEDNKINEGRIGKAGLETHHIRAKEDLPVVHEDFVIDALVGTGLTRPLSGLLLDAALHINESSATRISIDLPSGMYSEEDNSDNLDKIVKANWTLSFEAPKLNFMFPDMYPYTGDWTILDIGLDKTFISSLDSPYHTLSRTNIGIIRKDRNVYAHKGNFGHALLIAGGFGKMGAAILASRACLKSGVGLLTTFIPKQGYTAMQTSVPEAMVLCSDSENEISGDVDVPSFTTVGIGPGIGTSARTRRLLEQVLTTSSAPVIIDADGLNILAKNPALLNHLPKHSILTPHVKEFERMFGEQKSCHARLVTQIEASKKHNIYIVLKGRHSSITCPDGTVYFNTTGNPGMATGGSGDVLTGILTGLLAQGYTPQETCQLGCYIHGLSGDITVLDDSPESLTASDLINHIGKAFQSLD